MIKSEWTNADALDVGARTMTRLSEHYFGDYFRHNVEDEYVDLAIIPARPRVKQVDKEKIGDVNRKQIKEIVEEFL